MADVVALTSVLVTGVVAPLITWAGAWTAIRRSEGSTLRKEFRDVLDVAAENSAKWRRAAGFTIGLWERSVYDDNEESQMSIRERHLAAEGAYSSYARIIIRFGENSDVATRYEQIISCWSRITEALKAYRQHRPFDADTAAETKEAFANLGAAESRFLTAATKAVRRPIALS